MSDKIKITTGLKFKSTSFSDRAEIWAIKGNKADIMLTTSEGHSHIAEGWDIESIVARFESKEYSLIEKEISFGI